METRIVNIILFFKKRFAKCESFFILPKILLGFFMERILLFISLLFLAAVLWFQYVVSHIKAVAPHTEVDDLLFHIIPMHDFSWLYYGEIWIILLATAACMMFCTSRVKLSFIILSVAVLFFLRSIALFPTGLGSPTNLIIPQGNGLGLIYYLPNDLFFSGHTSSPLLMMFIFWKEKWARWFFLALSLLVAYAVLAMRIHYSIDVIGALFASYFAYNLSKWLYHHLENILFLLFKIHPAIRRKNPPIKSEN